MLAELIFSDVIMALHAVLVYLAIYLLIRRIIIHRRTHLKRELLNFVAGICGLLWLWVAILWVVSGWRSEGVFFGRGFGHKWSLRAEHNAFVLVWREESRNYAEERFQTPRQGVLGFDYNPAPPAGTPGPFGLAWASHGAAKVPHWFVMIVILSVPATIWGRRRYLARRLAQRTALGQCVKCGYDMRSSPGRCPECGNNRDALAARQRAG